MTTNKSINSCLQLSELGLNKATLGKSCAEEGSVDCNQDPGTFAEGNGREEETAPEKDLENSNQTHGGIVVFLDEFANGISQCVRLVGWLATWGSSSCGNLRWLEGWDQVGTSIGCDVEDRIDSEWEHREGVLGTEKPHKGHSCPGKR